MPYFDNNRTFAVGQCIGNDQGLRRFADEFYTMCLNNKSFPEVILEAEMQAFRTDNRNELVIMAEATTAFRLHMESAFDAALVKANTKERRFELICITLAALYTYQFGDGRLHPNSVLHDKLNKEIEQYNEEFGPDDLSFVKNFVLIRSSEIASERRKAEDALEERIMLRQEKAAQEEAERQRKKELRLLEERRVKEEQKILRRAKMEVWLERVKEIKKEPLAEQFQTILSNREVPAAYLLDYEKITDEDLKSFPKRTLVKMITSFLNVKDPGWKDLQKRAAEILAEE